MLLTYDLQSISNTAAHDSRVKEGRGCGLYIRDNRSFEYEHGDQRRGQGDGIAEDAGEGAGPLLAPDPDGRHSLSG